MSAVAWNRNVKASGQMQTHARALKLPEDFRAPELEYLSLRDYYINLVARKAQWDEALLQAKTDGDADLIRVAGGKIHGLNNDLQLLRIRVLEAGERSYAEVYRRVAARLLSIETLKTLEAETRRVLGRPEHELKSQT